MVKGISKVHIYSSKFEKSKTDAFISKHLPLFYFRIAYWGITLFLFLFTLGQFFLNKDRSFLYYALYLLSVLFFSLNVNEFFNRVPIFYHYIQGSFGIHFIISYPVIILYLLFADSFVDLKNRYPLAYKILRWVLWGTVVIGSAHLIMLLCGVDRDFLADYYRVSRGITYVPVAVILIIIGSKLSDDLTRFFLLGTLCMVLGTLASLLISIGLFPYTDNVFLNDAMFLNQCGFIAEFLFFSLGLGYKSRLSQLERNSVQNELIEQLQQNQNLQGALNLKLQTELDEGREAIIRTEYENKILQLESELLQTQMNPHFIFNSLNSIKHHALTRPPRETAKYLTKFAKLMRTILQNSKARLIPLNEEIEAMSLYVEIENKRFNEQFEFELVIDEELEINNVYIPPLLIQPYIENAIWHGLMHKDGDKRLKVEFSDSGQSLECKITDNGIGRKMSSEIKNRKNTYKKKSMGTQITSNRFDLVKQVYGKKAEVIIEDLVDDTNVPLGTLVKVIIPKLKKNEEVKGITN